MCICGLQNHFKFVACRTRLEKQLVVEKWQGFEKWQKWLPLNFSKTLETENGQTMADFSAEIESAKRNEFLVSKETVVLRRWERSKQKFGFIKRVDKGWITTVKGLESWCFER